MKLRKLAIRSLICSPTLMLIPYIIFLFYWVQSWLIVLILFAITYLGIAVWNELSRDDCSELQLPFRCLIFPFILAFGLTFLTGLGTSTIFNYDHEKHFAFFNDISVLSWPAFLPKMEQFQIEAGTPLVYYFAMYLPAALVHSWPGLSNFAPWVLYLTFAMPMFFFFIWLQCQFSNARSAPLFLYYLSFAGTDLLTWICWTGELPALGQHLDWIPKIPIPYQSIASQLFYTPQHWIPTTIFLMSFGLVQRKYSLVLLIFAWSLMPIWSIYVFIGSSPFVFILVCLRFRTEGKKILPLLLCSLIVILPQLALLAAKSNTLPAAPLYWESLGYILTFFCDKVLLVALLSILTWVHIRSSVSTWVLALALLLVVSIPFLSVPGAGDFVMRASQPTLIVLWYISASLFFKNPMTRKRLSAFIVVILLWIPNLFQEVYHAIISFSYSPWKVQSELMVPSLQPEFIAKQYIGKKNSMPWNLLLKNNENSSVDN